MLHPAGHDNLFQQLKRSLQAFQQNRLRTTYADLIKDPQYMHIARFFFEKLYTPEDFSRRNAGIQTLHRVLKGSMPVNLVSAVEMVFELHDVGDRLDDQMVSKMMEAGIGPDFDLTRYREVYRLLGNGDERLRQIHLLAQAASVFHRLCRSRIVGISLKTVRRVARLLGMAELIDFVHEGYMGFQAIEDIQPLVKAIEDREIAWHNDICNPKNSSKRRVTGAC